MGPELSTAAAAWARMPQPALSKPSRSIRIDIDSREGREGGGQQRGGGGRR